MKHASLYNYILDGTTQKAKLRIYEFVACHIVERYFSVNKASGVASKKNL